MHFYGLWGRLVPSPPDLPKPVARPPGWMVTGERKSFTGKGSGDRMVEVVAKVGRLQRAPASRCRGSGEWKKRVWKHQAREHACVETQDPWDPQGGRQACGRVMRVRVGSTIFPSQEPHTTAQAVTKPLLASQFPCSASVSFH